jgi:hypothetical protein
MKTKDFETLNNVFEIESKKPIETIVEAKPIDPKKDDFDLARDTLVNLIAQNQDALENIIHIAKNSESARAFEVAGTLIKTQSDIAKDLMELHKRKKDLDGESSTNNIKQQNNILFSGSTADLMKMLNDSKTK